MEALDSAGVSQVVCYAFGMKSISAISDQTNYWLSQNPIVPGRWDTGAHLAMPGTGIPPFSVDGSLVDGRTFPMLLKTSPQGL